MKPFNPFWLILYLFLTLTLSSALAFALGHTELNGWIIVAGVSLAGLAVWLPLVQRLMEIDEGLSRLMFGRSGERLRERPFDLLLGLATKVNGLLQNPERVAEMQTQLNQEISQAAAQQERNRLARELHDSIKQQLFSIQMNAAAARERIPTDPSGALEALDALQRSSQEAMVETNVLLLQLSPAPLEKVGLVQALRELCEALEYRTGAVVECEIGDIPPDRWLPAGTQEALFRIAQEATSNIARHARAQRVHFSLHWQKEKEQVAMWVGDDGQGFDLSLASPGSGLNGMRERAESVRGEFSLQSAPGKGVEVRVTVPVVPELEASADLPVANTTPNRVVLVGLLGGLIASACLCVPWYFQARTGLADAAYQNAIWPAIFSGIGAVLILVATGWLAGRSVKGDGILAGAVAGAAAGLTPYGLVGAAWAGLQGTAGMLSKGLVFIPDEAESIRLIVSGVGNTFLWVNGLYWALLACGIGLGALGGLISERSAARSASHDWRQTADLLATPLAVSSGFALLLGIFLLPVLENATLGLILRHAADRFEQIKRLIQFSVVSGLATPAIYFFAVHIFRINFLRSELRTSGVEDTLGLHWRTFWAMATSACVALISLVLFGLYRAEFAHSPGSIPPGQSASLAAAVMVGLASLLICLVYLNLAMDSRKKLVEFRREPPPLAHYIALLGAPVSLILAFVAIFSEGLGWLALAVVLSEALLLGYLVARRQPGLKFPASTQQQRRHLSARLRGAWLGMAYAFIAPVLAMGGAGLTILLITARMVPFFDSGRLPYPDLPALTILQLVEDIYLAQGGVYLGLLILGMVLTGLIIVGLALAGLGRRRGV